MHKFLKVLATALMLSTTPAWAGSCDDPQWTRAITEAMGRAPKAGECNASLYGKPAGHAERVIAVRKTLTHLYRDCYGTENVPTQKLPLRDCRKQSRAGGGIAK